MQSLVRQQQLQAESLEKAERAYDFAVQRYKAGLASQVTVLNTPFIRLMNQKTPNSMVSKLAQESFSKSKEYFTEKFITSLKGHQMELAHKAVFAYRKAVRYPSVLKPPPAPWPRQTADHSADSPTNTRTACRWPCVACIET